jgi:hypothetical protein
MVVLCIGSRGHAENADAAAWQISKSSGDVWVTTSGAQPVSRTDKADLNPGDSIRTGRNGRVLLVRGAETILIAPNSTVGIPESPKEGSSTTIAQQSGSILLEVEKRDLRNFEVNTPYLVAAVKGTQFRVSVSQSGASVEVLRGGVEVADFKSGQHALVLPGQIAKVLARGSGGLSLSGTGPLGPIQKGEPRSLPLQPVPVPRNGLTAPRGVPDGYHVRALGNASGAGGSAGRDHVLKGGGALRIAAPLGELKLDIQKATRGLARGTETSASRSGNGTQQTVWSSGDITPGNGVGKTYNLGNSGSGVGTGYAHSGGNGNGNGNGNGAGNGNGYGVGNGNAFGVGNGKAKGQGKH